MWFQEFLLQCKKRSRKQKQEQTEEFRLIQVYMII